MVTFIVGRSGYGKTTALRQIVCESAKKNGSRILVVVPEQHSFETERAYLKALGQDNLRRVEVYSFTRLSDAVFRAYGGLAGNFLSDAGRCVLVSQALREIQDRVKVYSRQVSHASFIRELADNIVHFKTQGVTAQLLRDKADTIGSDSLGRKLGELSEMVASYDCVTRDVYADPADNLARAAALLKQNNFFGDYTVAFDGFRGYTQNELDLVRCALSQSQNVLFTFTSDCGGDCAGEMSHFAQSVKMMGKIRSMALECGAGPVREISLCENHRTKSPELAALERQLFAGGDAFSEIPKDVFLTECTDVYDECQAIAGRIRRLVRTEKYRWRDFAVVFRDMDTYRPVLENIFRKYEISYFIDSRESAENFPLPRMVAALLDVMNKNFRSEDLFRFLKSGLTIYDEEEIALLENYAFVWNIQGGAWLKEWTGNPAGFQQGFSEEDAAALAKLNGLRIKIAEPIARLKKEWNGAGARKICADLYQYLQQVGVPEKVAALQKECLRQGLFQQGEELVSVYNLFSESLDQMVMLLGDRPLSLSDLSELFSVMMAAGDIGRIPQSLDQVLVSPADRFHGERVKICFIAGANSDVFPARFGQGGLFSETEIHKILQAGIDISQTPVEKAVEERYYAYRTMVSPSERLYVSYATRSLKGAAMTGSVLIGELKRIFPQIVVETTGEMDLLYRAESQIPAFELAASSGEKDPVLSETLLRSFGDNPAFRRQMDTLNRIRQSAPFAFRDSAAAKSLFGDQMRFSATQLEIYHSCRFRYFCRYGLRISPWKKAELAAPEAGSLIHYLLENLLKKFGDRLSELEDSELNKEMEALLAAYLETVMGGEADKTARFRYLFTRLSAIAKTLVLHMAKEFAQSKFRPCDFELDIHRQGAVQPYVIRLPDGGEVWVEGKVDRVDIMKEGDKSYIRIVDYKTGVKKFDLSDVLYGLNVQMLLYLFSIWKNGGPRYGEVIPAGVMYMPAKSPFADVGRDGGPEEAEIENQKELRMNGLLLDDSEVIRSMEFDGAGIFIPARLKKDGTLDGRSSVASLGQMGQIFKKIEKLLIQMGQTLRTGDIQALPAYGGGYDSCLYCDYRSVCLREPDDPVRPIVSYTRDEVMQSLEKDECGEKAPEQPAGEIKS